MRARTLKTRKRKQSMPKQSLRMNLLLLFLSLLFLAGTSRLFYMVTSQHLYKPIEWRINRIAMKTPGEPAPRKQEAKKQEQEKVTASGMDYMFWKILRDENPEKK